MKLRFYVWLLRVYLLVLCLPATARAETTTSGGLTGVVTDPSGAVVPNADVEINDNARGTAQSTRADREGVYRFFFLAPSIYMLTVMHEGFRTDSRAVNVLLGPPGTVNIALEIAKASSAITVTDEAPLIQAENGDVSATMNQKQIAEVPNPGNDLTYIVQTAPGVRTCQFGTFNGLSGSGYCVATYSSASTSDTFAGSSALTAGKCEVEPAASQIPGPQ